MQDRPLFPVSSVCPLRFPEPACFAALRGLLRDHGYGTEGGNRRPDTPLDLLLRLFSDEENVEKRQIEHLIPGGTELLESLGLLAELENEAGRSYATVTIGAVRSLYLASDRSSSPDGTPCRPPIDAVYPATDQTSHFLDSLPELPCRRLLDLGTGTGVAALLGARYAERAWAFDITGRAALFAEFNRRLNGLDNVSVERGDLYEPAGSMVFDRIVAHPPYVPVGGHSFVFRDGGEDGEQVTRRIIEGLPRHLAPGGCFYGYGMASDREDESFEERIRGWLGDDSPSFDVLLVADSIMTPDAVRSPFGAEERRHWTNVFEKYKVQYLFYGSFLLQRHEVSRSAFTLRTQAGGRTGWREIEWLRSWMTASVGAGMEDLLLNSRPVLSPRLEVHTVHHVREGRLAAEECTLRVDYPLEAECRCHPWIAQMVAGCDGRRSGREHLENSIRTGVLQAGAAPADFARVLAGMVTGGFLLLAEFPFPEPPVSEQDCQSAGALV